MISHCFIQELKQRILHTSHGSHFQGIKKRGSPLLGEIVALAVGLDDLDKKSHQSVPHRTIAA